MSAFRKPRRAGGGKRKEYAQNVNSQNPCFMAGEARELPTCIRMICATMIEYTGTSCHRTWSNRTPQASARLSWVAEVAFAKGASGYKSDQVEGPTAERGKPSAHENRVKLGEISNWCRTPLNSKTCALMRRTPCLQQNL